MILADTSVWRDHFRGRSRRLAALLSDRQIVMHPWVLGELACGALGPRGSVMADLRQLPRVPVADDEAVLRMIDMRKLYGTGVGWIDVQLLAAALLANVRLFSMDRRLAGAAGAAGVGYPANAG